MIGLFYLLGKWKNKLRSKVGALKANLDSDFADKATEANRRHVI